MGKLQDAVKSVKDAVSGEAKKDEQVVESGLQAAEQNAEQVAGKSESFVERVKETVSKAVDEVKSAIEDFGPPASGTRVALIDRSGHHRHGLNMQVNGDNTRRILWVNESGSPVIEENVKAQADLVDGDQGKPYYL